MTPALSATLAQLAPAFEGLAGRWWLIGSSAVTLHGGPAEPRDVDVLVEPGIAYPLAVRLGATVPTALPAGRFRSEILLRTADTPMPIEIMAGLRLLPEGELVMPQTRQAFDVAGVRLFAPAREELRAILRRFGRPKDHARAALL